jgi:hypothetical protein
LNDQGQHATAAPIVTAGLRPELFDDAVARRVPRAAIFALVAVLVVAGFVLRAYQLGAEGLSEDELNKLTTVADYRAHGLTGANGEHPFLMKALQTVSVVADDHWNAAFANDDSRAARLKVSVETALRLPSAIFGALATVLIFLVASELFGAEVGLIAAALWAFDPAAISFNRIAKEDTFFLFFFLLAAVFWLRGQRAAESGEKKPERYYLATGAAFGAMLASKYLPYFTAVFASYNYVFQLLPTRRWQIGRRRYLALFAVAGAVFLVCNPTILLPSTWREMLAFSSYKTLGHDGYEFLGTLYPHKFTDWLRGVPWYFYFVFAAVKLPPPTIVASLVGLPLLFRRRAGDGRYFILFWLFYWVMGFTFLGGKFTRYFTLALPALLITAAIGVQFIGRLIARALNDLSTRARAHATRLDQTRSIDPRARSYATVVLSLLLLVVSARADLISAPHYRLYTNALGGGASRAGYYFPHDEFYDAAVRETMFEIARRATLGGRVASETPTVCDYYARQTGRDDLVFVSLSDPLALADLRAGDLLLVARGRRYFSNDALFTSLRQNSTPAFRVPLGSVEAVDVYVVDAATLPILRHATAQGTIH